MNDYTEYPVLMWMLTTAVLAVVIVGAAIPLVAGLTTFTSTKNGQNR
ncbi:hypothetical protein ACFWHR_12100 [Leucobacter sp. NPDC058333]